LCAGLSAESCSIALQERWFTVLASACTPDEDNDVKKHRLILFLTAAFILLTAPFAHPDSGWVNDYKRAQQEAKASDKFILLDFTGSDWCPWCKKFDKEILSQSQFKDYARENLVLMEVDFPRAKLQSPELKKQNQELARQYQVEGFPTVVVLSGDGQKLWQYDGYFPDGPAAFIAQLEKLRKG
jgi:thioredoxin-related protein